GYVKTYFGAKRPWRPPGIPAALADGQRITGVRVPILRGAVISGRVLDEPGGALASGQVHVEQSGFVNGERKLTRVPGSLWATTDDRGAYRIYGLAPGDYAVFATAAVQGGGVRQVTQAEIDAALSEI